VLIKLVVVFVLLVLSGCQTSQTTNISQAWEQYKTRFVLQDGRVMDTGNNNISHSEGQGYGLLLAVRNNDHATFDAIWRWSQENLQVRQDKLFIWRRRPGISLKDEDMNNASDGDIIIAWALLEASQKWQKPDYQTEALDILHDIKAKLIVSWRGLAILLPGAYGFIHKNSTDINLSYWIFPAFRLFEIYDNDPVWRKLQESGVILLQQARFGLWKLPGDWIKLKQDNSMSVTKNNRFGYDAIRIPLYLIWGQQASSLLDSYSDYWSFYGQYTPAWIALNQPVMDAYGAGDGIKAIKRLVMAIENKGTFGETKTLPDQDYYQTTLFLLSQLCYQQVSG